MIPIRREAQVIGLLLLESTSDSQGNLSFLNNLSDSAAIAIANARLYDEVQRATLRRRFVPSWHMIENLTYIKVSELLEAGSVGPIT